MAVDKKMMWTFGGLVALVVIGVVLMVVSMFGKSAGKKSSDGSVALTIPDGEVRPVADSKSAAMRGAVSLDQYFGELVPEGEPKREPEREPVARSEGSVVERVFGAAGDGRSELGMTEGRPGMTRGKPGLTKEERLEYDRKRVEMVREVLSGGSSVSEESPVTDDAPKKEIFRFAQNDNDGIITTLDDEPSEGVGYGLRPFRCMFVRDEKLRNGQRVTVRLLEELSIDGILVPENTHVQAICKIGERLELQVRSLDMGGRIVPLVLDAYDMDGLQGIYCPETAASRATKKVSDEAISMAGRTLGGLVGDLASTALRTGATLAKSATGEKCVAVVSGYEFYLVKSEKR